MLKIGWYIMYDIALSKATDGIEELLQTLGRSSYWLIADMNLCSDLCDLCRRVLVVFGRWRMWWRGALVSVHGTFSAESLLVLVQLSPWVPRIW